MKTLVDGADGMFRWVSCQMDYLCECSTDKDRLEALQKLPPDLPRSYERILDRVNRSTRENQTLVRNALHWIAYARSPLKTTQLLQALAISTTEDSFNSNAITTEDELLHWCSSLVRRNLEADVLEFAHFTVKEFLSGIQATSLPGHVWYRLTDDHSILALACDNILGCRMFDGISTPNPALDLNERCGSGDAIRDVYYRWNKKYPIILYAGCNFSHHVHQSDWILVAEYFWKTFAPTQYSTFESWSNFVMNFMRMRRDYIDKFPPPGPLHFAAMFAFDKLCAKLLQSGLDVNQESYLGKPMNCALRVDRCGEPPSCLDDDSCLQDQPRAKREEILRILVAAKAEVYQNVDPLGSSAIKIAIRKGSSMGDLLPMKILLLCGLMISATDMEYLYEMTMVGDWKKHGSPLPMYIIDVVIESNGTNLVPGAHPYFVNVFLQVLARGYDSDRFSRVCILEPGLFVGDELLELRHEMDCDYASKQESLIKIIIRAIRRTSNGQDEYKAMLRAALPKFAEGCQPLRILTLLKESSEP